MQRSTEVAETGRGRMFRKAIVVFVTAAMIPTAAASAQQQTDSIQARRKAVNAQARFEMVRRINLPVQPSGGGGNNCDAHIGRFCQWNDSDDTVEAKQPRVIRRAREALLASLDTLA